MSDNNSKKTVKRHVHIGRVAGAAVILILLIIGIVILIQALSGGKNNNNSVNNNANVSQTTSETTTTEATTTEPQLDARYQYITVSADDVHKGQLILVNNWTKFQAEEGADLVSVYDIKNDSYMVKDTLVQIHQDTTDPLTTMLTDFANEKGLYNVMIISGFRSVQRQSELYDEDLQKTGLSYSTLVTVPGFSEHHTGYAMDFGLYSPDWSSEYDGTGEYAWINENCKKYGFVVRYPSDKTEITGIDYEPWHFRYTNVPHSYVIMDNGMCFEEYIELLKQYPFENEHLFATDKETNTQYEIYYVPMEGDKLQIPVPATEEYTISGNNVDGFIITVKLATASQPDTVVSVPEMTTPVETIANDITIDTPAVTEETNSVSDEYTVTTTP